MGGCDSGGNLASRTARRRQGARRGHGSPRGTIAIPVPGTSHSSGPAPTSKPASSSSHQYDEVLAEHGEELVGARRWARLGRFEDHDVERQLGMPVGEEPLERSIAIDHAPIHDTSRSRCRQFCVRSRIVSDDRLRFETDPSRYRHWKLEINGSIATLAMAVDPTGGLRDDYELKLNSYDLSCRHRAARRAPAAAVRAPERQGDRDHRRTRQGVLRGSEHPDARHVHPRPQGRVLQVHERDPQRHRRDVIRRRAGRARRGERHRSRRRVRARARLRRDPARRRSLVRCVAAGGAAARGAPRHRRPHSRRRQAPRAPRPRRRLLDQGGGHQGQAGCRVGPRRLDRAADCLCRARARPRARPSCGVRSS